MRSGLNHFGQQSGLAQLDRWWQPWSRFQLIFIGNLRGLQASLAIILKIKDKWRKSLKESYIKICEFHENGHFPKDHVQFIDILNNLNEMAIKSKL